MPGRQDDFPHQMRDADGQLVLRSRPLSPRSSESYEVWTDPKRDYLITRVIHGGETRVDNTTDLKYQAADDGWSLSEWEFTDWNNEGVERSYKLKIKSVNINEELPDHLFTPPDPELP